MHKLALAGLLAASGLLTGCVNQPQSLYYWNGYQEQVYARFKGEGSSPQEQVAALEASLPVRVVRRLPWWISIEPRNAAAV